VKRHDGFLLRGLVATDWPRQNSREDK
jgi:hypothetical protein